MGVRGWDHAYVIVCVCVWLRGGGEWVICVYECVGVRGWEHVYVVGRVCVAEGWWKVGDVCVGVCGCKWRGPCLCSCVCGCGVVESGRYVCTSVWV